MSLARSNIEFYWRQTFTTVVILAFVGLLIFHQVGGVLGRWNSLGEFQREVTADLAIGAVSETARVTRPLGQALPGGVEAVVLTHPNVDFTEPYRHPFGSIPFADLPRLEHPRLVFIDPSERSLMFPKSAPDELRDLLRASGVVAVNTTFARRFDVALGDIEAFGDEQLQIAAILPLYESQGPLVFRAPVAGGAPGAFGRTTIGLGVGVFVHRSGGGLLLRLRDRSQFEQTAAELRSMLPRSVRVLTPDELVVANNTAQLLQEDEIRSSFITAAFTILISALIATQTLRGAILTHRDQYGALMALGVSRWRLVRTAMETAFWIGALSIALSTSGALIMERVMEALGTRFALTTEVILVTAGLLMVISFIAGLASLGALMRVAPAALLR